MDNIKIYVFNGLALAFSVTDFNPILQSVALSLTIIYTLIQISKKVK